MPEPSGASARDNKIRRGGVIRNEVRKNSPPDDPAGTPETKGPLKIGNLAEK